MISIYYADSNLVKKNKILKDLVELLPENAHQRAYRYKFEKDTYNFAVGRLLLQRGLKDLNREEGLDDIQYLDSGKPYLENVFFNISHTDGMVVCALSTNGEIGIDIEKVQKIRMDDFDAWFTKSEWADINKASLPSQKFYWYWTRKESIIKALGKNLSYLHKIELDATKDFFLDEGKKWYLKDLDLGTGFIGALCSENETDHIEVSLVKVAEF